MQDQSLNALRTSHSNLKDSLTWYISYWKNAEIHLVQGFSKWKQPRELWVDLIVEILQKLKSEKMFHIVQCSLNRLN